MQESQIDQSKNRRGKIRSETQRRKNFNKESDQWYPLLCPMIKMRSENGV